MKTGKMMKLCGVLVAVTLAGSVSGMAQSRGDYHGGGRSDRGGWHGDHSYWDGGRHYGYYRNPAGELVFGLLGLGMLAAVVSAADRPVYVQQPVVVRESPQVVYVQQPVVVQQPVSITVNIQNSNGSFTPVILRQAGAQWVGPKGEYYDAMPSVGQLRPVYGF